MFALKYVSDCPALGATIDQAETGMCKTVHLFTLLAYAWRQDLSELFLM